MSITKTQAKLPTAVTDNNVDIAYLDPTKWVEDRTGIIASANVSQARYVYADGNKAHSMTLTIRIALDSATKRDAMQHVSVKLSTRQLIADSVSGITSVGKPIVYFIGYEIPIENDVPTADLRLGLSAIYGATCDGITAGVPGNGYLDTLGQLVPNILSA